MGRAFIAVHIVLFFLAAVVVVLRVLSRRLKKADLDASDYFCFIALVGLNLLRGLPCKRYR